MKSFLEAYPELSKEWSAENILSPDELSYGSNKMIIWNGACGHTWSATAKNRGHGSGCPVCSGAKVAKGENDLATMFPKLGREWSKRNLPLKPCHVTVKSNKQVWWRCRKCNYEWRARISDRTDGHGCPLCAGEILVAGFNDLMSEHSDIAEEWSERNLEKPSDVFSKSRKNVWWHCKICGNEYQAVINTRVNGFRCPICAEKEKVRKPYHSVDEERIFRIKTVIYYLNRFDEAILINDDTIIGIPLGIYIPSQKAAIEFSRALRVDYRVYMWNGRGVIMLGLL